MQAPAQHEARTLVSGAYEAFARGDVPAVLAVMHPSIEWTEAEGSPYAGTYVGTDAVKEGVFARLGSEWERFEAVPSELIVDGGRVVVLGELRGTYKATGRSFRSPFAHVWWLESGKAIRFRVFTDTDPVQRAMER
ncbi:MAG: nuclear transport factor 2 family protein [Gemmatimonadota bacterium]